MIIGPPGSLCRLLICRRSFDSCAWFFFLFCFFQQPNSELSGDTRLYITLMKKLDKLPLPSVDAKIYGIEVKQTQESGM